MATMIESEAIRKASTLVASLGLDFGPLVACRHITKSLLGEMVQIADPCVPEYVIDARLALTMRDRWVVEFAKQLPDGVVECPSTICIRVFDDTGEVQMV